MANLNFTGLGEIKEDPTLSYEIVYDASNDNTYKKKRNNYKSKTIKLSSAEILACGSQPIDLLPAPGPLKYYDWYAFIEYKFVTTEYSMGSGFAIQQGTVNKIPIGTLGVNVEDFVVIVRPAFATGFGTGHAFSLNNALVFDTLSGADPTLGDGTITIKLYYKIITFNK